MNKVEKVWAELSANKVELSSVKDVQSATDALKKAVLSPDYDKEVIAIGNKTKAAIQKVDQARADIDRAMSKLYDELDMFEAKSRELGASPEDFQVYREGRSFWDTADRELTNLWDIQSELQSIMKMFSGI